MEDKNKQNIVEEKERKNSSTLLTTSEQDLLTNDEKEANFINEDLGEAVGEDLKEEKTNAEKESTAKEGKHKYIIYLAIILAITAIILAWNLLQPTELIKSLDPETGEVIEYFRVYESLPTVLSNVHWGYFFLFFGSVWLGVMIPALILLLFTRLYTKKYNYGHAVANTMVGNFYDSITPGASGGQFAQVVIFKKQGLSVANSASIFVMAFILYQITLVFMGLLSFILRFGKVISVSDLPITVGQVSFSIPLWAFIAFGFTLNIIVIIGLILMSSSKKFLNFVCNGVIGFLAKIKLLKNPDEKRRSLKMQVENYNIEFRRLRSNIPFSIGVIMLYTLAFINTNMQPFFCGLSLNAFDFPTALSGLQWFDKVIDSIAYSNFHQMVSGLLPIPGASGISEIVYGALFGKNSGFYAPSFYEAGGLNILTLYWRFMTYYFPFIIYGVVAATYKTKGLSLQERVIPVGNRKTMLTIQMDTYEERKASSDTMYTTKMLERKEVLEKIKAQRQLNREKAKLKKQQKQKIEVVKEDDPGTMNIGD